MSITSDQKPVECDRCGREIHELEPVTNLQFSGAMDALRMVCPDCIQDLVATWNEGDAIEEGER